MFSFINSSNLLSVLIVLLCSVRAFACGCEKPGPPCKALGEASAVFIGTVKGVTEGARKQKPNGEVDFSPRLFKLSVDETFSGTPTREVEVATGLSSDDCGYPFVKGASYLGGPQVHPLTLTSPWSRQSSSALLVFWRKRWSPTRWRIAVYLGSERMLSNRSSAIR